MSGGATRQGVKSLFCRLGLPEASWSGGQKLGGDWAVFRHNLDAAHRPSSSGPGRGIPGKVDPARPLKLTSW